MSKPLSLRKAAARLGCAPSTLGNYIRAGFGPEHIWIAETGARKFTLTSLDSWAEARRVVGTK